MLRRELAIVLCARGTWLIAALAALLIGHSFVLAIDLFAAGSRSVQSGGLMSREFDPLLGIARPTLGGLYLSLSLLAPLVAARSIAVEQERRSLRVLLLQTAMPVRLLVAKYLAACAGVSLLLLPVLLCLGMWRVSGGHLFTLETAVALLGHVLYLLLLTAVGCAAATWTSSVAQATALTLLAVLGSWGIDAAEGFSALSWLSAAADFSLTPHLQPFERGIFSLRDAAWFLSLTLGALALALTGLRFDVRTGKRVLSTLLIVIVTALLLRGTTKLSAAYDCTEERRNSLPKDTEHALQQMGGTLSLAVSLDREDARRRLIDSDVISPLRLARPDLRVKYPLDDGSDRVGSTHNETYGQVTLCIDSQCKDSYSTQRRELVTLLFEIAGQRMPQWLSTSYRGYPFVVEGTARAVILFLSYGFFPVLLGCAGLVLTRRRRRK